jgi:hypothetical protein
MQSDWMYKHLNLIPAVAVVFFELEWDERNWAERQAACAKTIRDLRYACLRPSLAAV